MSLTHSSSTNYHIHTIFDVQNIFQESHDEDIEQKSICDEAYDRSSMFGDISDFFVRRGLDFRSSLS